MADSPEELRRKSLETASIVEETLRSITDNISAAFEAAVAGTDRVSQTVAKDIQARFNKLAKVTDDLASNAFKLQQGLLDVKKVQDQINERKIKELSLGTQLVTYLRRQGNAIGTIDDLIQRNIDGSFKLTDLAERLGDEYKDLIEDYKLTLEYGEDHVRQLEEQKSSQDEINAKLGNTGKLVKGISKIPILGNLVDTNEALKAMTQNIAEGGNKTSAMKAGFKNIGNQIKTSLTDPLTITTFFVTQFVGALKSADTATGNLAKDFNITYDAAADVRNELIEIGNLSGNIALNARALQESMVAVGKSLGSNAILNQADLETFTELREMAGYTNEELIGIQKLTLATGGNLKDNTNQFLGTVSALNAQNKLTVNEKQLLKEVSNTSAAIKLSIGGTTKDLAASAFQAKQFGINLDQADKIAESLLDFESSITNELSAELLTGKDLNLEKARLLALNGDIAGSSAEILRQVGGTAEFTKMNRIQQEALAKAVGMSREDLAASLIEREALSKIGVQDAAAAKEKFDTLVKQYGYDKAVTMLGDEQYANQLKQQSIQERMNKSIEKMKEIFISIAEPVMAIISPIVDILTPALSVISGTLGFIFSGFKGIKDIIESLFSPTESLKNTLAEMGPVTAFIATSLGIAGIAVTAQLVPGLIRAGVAAFAALPAMIATAIAAISSASAVTLGIGAIAIIGGIAAAVAAMNSARSSSTSIKDGMINPSGGLVVSGEKGTYSLDKNDSIIAGTNLSKPVSTSNSNSQQDLSPLLEEMRAMRQETAQSNNKPVIVENSIDGTKFGTAVAMNTYKIK